MKTKFYVFFLLLFLPVCSLAQSYEGIVFIHPKETEEKIEKRRKEQEKRQQREFVEAFVAQADLYRKKITLEENNRASQDLKKIRKTIKRKDKLSLEAMDHLLISHESAKKVLSSSQSAEKFYPTAEEALKSMFEAWKKLETINAPMAKAAFRPLNHYYWIEYQMGNFHHKDGRPLNVLSTYIKNYELRKWIETFDGNY